MTIRMNLKMEARSQEKTSQGTFSLTCWEWAPLYFLLVDYCSLLIDEDTLRKLADFGGEGPEVQDSCDLVANALELAIHIVEPERAGKHSIDVFASASEDLRVNEEGNQLTPGELEDSEKFRNSVTPYRITTERIEEFISFLRQCGGFKVS